MLGRAHTNKVSLSLVKSHDEMKLLQKKAKQHQKAHEAKIKKILGDD